MYESHFLTAVFALIIAIVLISIILQKKGFRIAFRSGTFLVSHKPYHFHIFRLITGINRENCFLHPVITDKKTNAA
jgi:hypothetical protein